MANTFAKSAMAALWDEVAETTSINQTLSKSLDVYDMDSDTNMDRNVANAGAGQDQEWIPQEYRFEVQDGIVSQESDFQDLVDRNIPVRRNQARRILAQISTKDLRDPMRRQKKAQGMARDMANAIDLFCYQSMLNQASIIHRSTNAFSYQDAIDAETLMLNRGLSAFDRKLFLSNRDYNRVAKDLGQNQYNGPGDYPADALTKAMIPPLATFDTMRSDYLLNVNGNTTANITVNGANQNHTVATYDSNNFFLDNRSQSINLTNATTTNFPVGTKFTIAGVNALNEESRTDNGELQTFTVITAGNGSATIQPAIVTSGPYRNCSAAPADAAQVTILNSTTSAPSLFYTPESTVIIPGRLPVPQDAGGVEVAEATTQQGLPMRMTYWYDPHNEIFKCKALVYFDCQVIYPNMLGMILSGQS